MVGNYRTAEEAEPGLARVPAVGRLLPYAQCDSDNTDAGRACSSILNLSHDRTTLYPIRPKAHGLSAAAGANAALTAAPGRSSSAGTSRIAIAPPAATSTSATTVTCGGCGLSPIVFPSGSASSFCTSGSGSRAGMWASFSSVRWRCRCCFTIPRRYGLAIAITYLIRKRWPDPKDRVPAHCSASGSTRLTP